jgi:hypothetical protein
MHQLYLIYSVKVGIQILYITVIVEYTLPIFLRNQPINAVYGNSLF